MWVGNLAFLSINLLILGREITDCLLTDKFARKVKSTNAAFSSASGTQ